MRPAPSSNWLPHIWDRAQSILNASPRHRAATSRAQTPALLKGLIFGPDGRPLTPTHTRKGGRLYRYYISQSVLKGTEARFPSARVPAAEIERMVIDELWLVMRSPEIIAGTHRHLRASGNAIPEADVRMALTEFEPLWDELFPAEQARIVQLLVERVDVGPDAIEIHVRLEGLASVASDLRMRALPAEIAA